MNNTELTDYFIRHAPDFHRDLDLSGVDDKHTAILKSAYEQIRNDAEFSRRGFRNWAGQTDMMGPAQVTSGGIRSQGLARTLLRYAYRKVFRRQEDAFLMSSILDDIDVIVGLGGERLLKENPVEATPGVGDFCRVRGASVNLRWLRYVYLLKRILATDMLEAGAVWVDVGSYYGGLQGLVRKYQPTARLVLVDFHHQLCRSFIYLSQLFPAATHIPPARLAEYENPGAMPPGGIMYVPVSRYDYLQDQTAGLVTNFFSLGEMRREFFTSYMRSRLFTHSRHVFLVNRFVSAPFFDRTYDSDVALPDYLLPERHIEYFDMFPIHHYLLSNRPVFGREIFRNVSSPYFEMVTSRREP